MDADEVRGSVLEKSDEQVAGLKGPPPRSVQTPL